MIFKIEIFRFVEYIILYDVFISEQLLLCAKRNDCELIQVSFLVFSASLVIELGYFLCFFVFSVVVDADEDCQFL